MPAASKEAPKVVVDGSNIATEGRTMPSLAQLVSAVADFTKEYPDYEVIVVVDATFGHRIDPSEKADFDDAASHGDLVSPPAGAIGRGDAFLLRIADRTGAMILSNDSFQEFHGEFDWLFDKGRLLGGTPVPGVGWIFTPRSPVRGPKSREAVKEARRSSGGTKPARAEKSSRPPRGGRAKAAKEPVEQAIETALHEAEDPSPGRRRGRSRGRAAPAEPVNEPMPFITFVSNHPPGSEVEGEVESFSSHGAFIDCDGLRCYIPLGAMADPPPRAARDVMRKGDTVTFVVQAFDPPRRGVELALPGFAHVSGRPTEETVDAEITEAPARRGRGRGRAAPKPTEADPLSTEPVSHIPRPKIGDSRPSLPRKVDEPTPAKAGKGVHGTLVGKPTGVQKAAAKKVASDAAKTAKKAAAKKVAPKKAAVAGSGGKVVAKKSATKSPVKATPTKSAAKAPAKAAAKKAAAKSTAKSTRSARSAAKKAPAAKSPVKTTKATGSKSAAKKPTASKATASKAAAKKSPARSNATKKVAKTPAKQASVKMTAKKAAAKTATKKAANKR